ncbi:MAG: pantetheine-phosphate adenylyltransferase [bacterium]
MKQETIAVYPGSFDPVTLGHLDLIRRSLKIFDRVIVAVVSNPNKKPCFSLHERIEMLQETTQNLDGQVEVDSFEGLLVHYLKQKKANIVIRGLRAISDFEYEFEMALMNRRLSNDVETIFLTPSEEFTFLRARLVKEIALLGGDISSLVPATVMERLNRKIAEG